MLDPTAALAIASSLVERGLAAGASAADAIYSGDRSTTVQVRLGDLEQVSQAEGEGVALRLFDGQRSASVASSDFSDEALGELVIRCLAMARQAPEDDFAGLAPADLLERNPPTLDLGDELEPGPEALRERALAAEAAALAVSGVANSTGSGAMAGLQIVALATSGGFAGAYRGGSHGCLAGVIAGEGSTMQRDFAYHSVRHLEELEDPRTIGERAGQRAVARLNPARVKPGTYPILFDPRISASLLNHFAAAISGSAVSRGTSFLKDWLGERVFAPSVSIVDDPLRPRGLRSHSFDAEGVRVTRQKLVDDGQLIQWIADSAAARQLGIVPTGHAARGGGAAPSNLTMEPGTRTREELLAAFSEAVLIVELIGQGVNGITGDYSRGAAGFMVRGGEIAEPVSEITIASNLTDMFATLEPGSDLEWRKGIDAPTILVPAMTVASA
ncbi:MAG: metallopeptidase TldD-related protein [Sphingomicrobium sp.]